MAGLILKVPGRNGISTALHQGTSFGEEAFADWRGVAVGYKAKAINGGIQLGEGTNTKEKTLQIFDKELLDTDGNIPLERMNKYVYSKIEVDAAASEAKTELKAYTERKANEAKIQAIDAATTESKEYTNKVEADIKQDLDRKADIIYTDNSISKAKEEVITNANAYTDKAKAAIGKDIEQKLAEKADIIYVGEKDAETKAEAVIEANKYTDTKSSGVIAEAKAYTDTKSSDAIAEGKEYTDSAKAEVMESVSKSANALKESVRGETVTIDDVSPIPHTVNMKVKTKNLALVTSGAVGSGVTWTVNEDQSITTNGTPTNNTFLAISPGLVTLEAGKTYTFSHIGNYVGSEYYSFSVAGTSEGVCANTIKSVTFTPKKTGNLNLGIILYKDVTYDNVSFKVQIEEGDTATAITPYIDPTTATLTVYGTDATDRKQTFEPSSDCTYKVASISPKMTLLTDKTGVLIEAEYNQDICAFKENVTNTIAQLKQAIIELGGTV